MASKPKKKQKSKPLATCAVCRKTMKQVTPAHLATHGLTPSRYRRMYGVRPTLHGAISLPKDDPTLPQEVANRLLDDNVWLGCIASEVGERMLNGPLRQRLSMTLVTMLHQRSVVNAEAMAILSAGLQELKEDWRLTHGGPDHGPTSTEELLRIVSSAERIFQNSETAIQKAIKLALEEQKAASEYADGIGPSLYSGQAEKAGPLAELPAGDRESIRILTNRLAAHLSKRREPVDASVKQVTPSGGSPVTGGGATQAPITNDATMQPPSGTNDGASTNDAASQGASFVSQRVMGHPTPGGTPHPPTPIDASFQEARQRNVSRGGHENRGAPTANKSMRNIPGGDAGGSSEQSQDDGEGSNVASNPDGIQYANLPCNCGVSMGTRTDHEAECVSAYRMSNRRPFDPATDASPSERAFFGDDELTPEQKLAKKKAVQRKRAAASKRKKGVAGAQPKKATKKTVKKKATKRGKKKVTKKRKPKGEK